ncbi:MAG TPA: hypothetical protein VJ987_10080, partial [Anaerolineales bacterium]|nr:hypothetical protein [Anaerolineales bacterium]
MRANHHGSQHSTSQYYVDTLDPDASAISCGNNTYGHPGQAVLDRLLGTGDVYLTNLCDVTRNYGAAVIVNGDIILQSTDGVNYTINGTAYVASDPSGSNPTPTATTPPTATPTAIPNDHVGDLDGSTSSAKGGKWNATITITVGDSNHSPIANATVSGVWSGGASGSDSCVTDANGQCAITTNNISRNSSSATFTVTDVTQVSYAYSSADNHDPDGDSNGTVITVNKP